MTDAQSEDVSELGYPTSEMESLLEGAHHQYLQQVKAHGPGKNWLQDEARWHIWKACDELFQARDHAHRGDYEQSRYHFGDALNHMLFAMEIVNHADQNTPREQ
jgi:hypothetical protein